MPKAEALLEKLQARIAAAPEIKAVKTPARLKRPSAELFSDNDREWIREQIRTLRRIYGLEWFVRQELFGKYGLEDLTDEELATLLRRVERAVQCIREGVSFEDADLIRNHIDLSDST